MPYIIRNQIGEMLGHCTNKPGAGNKLPNGDDEVHDYYDDSDAAKVAEVSAFRAAQDAKLRQRVDPLAALKGALVARGVISQSDLDAASAATAEQG